MKPYTIESYKAGKKPVTRSGEEITEFNFYEKSSKPFCFSVKGWENFIECSSLGRNIEVDNWDLFEAPVKREGWINIYADGDFRNVSNIVHPSESVAKEQAGGMLLTTIKIEWEE